MDVGSRGRVDGWMNEWMQGSQETRFGGGDRIVYDSVASVSLIGWLWLWLPLSRPAVRER